MSFAPSDVMMMRRQDSSKQYNRNRKKHASTLCFIPKGKMMDVNVPSEILYQTLVGGRGGGEEG